MNFTNTCLKLGYDDAQGGHTKDGHNTTPYFLRRPDNLAPHLDAYGLIDFLRKNNLFVIRHVNQFVDNGPVHNAVHEALKSNRRILLHLDVSTDHLQQIWACPQNLTPYPKYVGALPENVPSAASSTVPCAPCPALMADDTRYVCIFDKYALDKGSPLPKGLADALGWLKNKAG
jgi:hypothetical protein